MINKIVRKSMLKKKGLLFAISILIIISSVFVGLTHFVYDTMDANYEQIKIDSNVEDFKLYTLPVDEETFDTLYSDETIERLERKYNISLELQNTATYKTDDDSATSYGISQYNEDDRIDTIILEDGELPTNEGDVVIQPQALIQLGLEIGDTLSIDGSDYTISGTAYLVTQLFPADFTNNQMFPDFEKYTPLVMNSASYDKLDQDSDNLTFQSVYKGKFFNSKMRYKRRQNIYDKIIDDTVVDIPVLDDQGMPQITATGQLVTEEVNTFLVALDKDFNPSISSVENEIQGARTTFVFLAGLLSVITIFLATILVNSVFKSQRREMGIMKAEGVSIPKLGFGFAFFILIVVLISSLIGGYLSTFASEGMRNLYAETYMLKDYMINSNVIETVIGNLLSISIIMIIIVYIVSIRRNLNTPTLHLIKNIDSEKAPKHNIGKLFKKLSFVRKYQLNLALRNLSKTVLLGFAVLVSSFLLLLGVLMYTSVHNMMDNMYQENFTFNYVVMFSEPNIATADEVENGMISSSATLESVSHEELLDEPLTGNETVNIEAYDFDESTTVNLEDIEGNKLTNDYDGLIASSGFLQQYNLAIGDQIIVQNPYDVNSNVTLDIVAETDDFFLPYVYMPIDTFREKFDVADDMINGYQSTGELTNSVKKQIKDEDPSAFIYESADMQDMMGDSLQMLNVAIVIIGVLAAVIAFIALYSISTVIIESNSKTISVMKVLGYSSKEVRKMTIGIYKWLVIIIYLLSIPLLESMIQSTVNYAMRDMGFELPIHLNYGLSLLGIVVIYIVYIISSNITYRKIDKIKLSESLKADE